MDIRDKIMQVINLKGPTIPAQLTKEIDSDILLTSAYLSELVFQKKLRISSMKVGGGSPLYYVPGQENKLQEYYSNLNEKNQKAFEFLKENQVLRESELSPLMRVAMREIKDFAKPLEVEFKDHKEIFWKWYLLNNDEASQIIREKLDAGPRGQKQQEGKEKQEKPEIIGSASRTKVEEQAAGMQNPEDEKTGAAAEEQDLEAEKEAADANENLEKPKETEDKKPRAEAKPAEKENKGVQKPLSQPISENIEAWNNADSVFIRKLKKYFDDKEIEVKEANINRKDSDIEFILKIGSAIGEVEYFCKAKNKKKINDGDLSSVFIQSQMKKLPALFLITGDMTKKAEDMLSSELKGMSVVKVS